MRALIVGRTHMGRSNACVGAIAVDNGRSLRLFTAAGEYPGPIDYQVGQIWDLGVTAKLGVTAPHVEDVIVSSRTLVGVDPDPRATVLGVIEPWHVPLEEAFEGSLHIANEKMYVSPDGPIPSCSTGFWIADRVLELHDDRYSTGVAPWLSVKHVGLDPGPPQIRPGELVRLSLAGWYQGDFLPEPRCYLQVSGSFG